MAFFFRGHITIYTCNLLLFIGSAVFRITNCFILYTLYFVEITKLKIIIIISIKAIKPGAKTRMDDRDLDKIRFDNLEKKKDITKDLNNSTL